MTTTPAATHPLRKYVRHLGGLYPLKSGYSVVAHLGPLPRWTSAPEVATAKLRDGSDLLVQADDFIGRTIYYLGDFDPKVTWLCRRLLRPGDGMLDIGANMGVVAIQAARLVGPTGRVHAFEPQPALVALLRRSSDLNRLKNLEIHGIGLSDRDGELPLYGRVGETATASLVQGYDAGEEVLGHVPVRHAGDYLRTLDIPPVGVLKIDVEDHEAAVLEGARSFMEANRPRAVVFESHDRGQAFFEREPVQILASLDYEFFEVPKAKLRMRVRHLAPGAAATGESFDFVAVGDAETRRTLVGS